MLFTEMSISNQAQLLAISTQTKSSTVTTGTGTRLSIKVFTYDTCTFTPSLQLHAHTINQPSLSAQQYTVSELTYSRETKRTLTLPVAQPHSFTQSWKEPTQFQKPAVSINKVAFLTSLHIASHLSAVIYSAQISCSLLCISSILQPT